PRVIKNPPEKWGSVDTKSDRGLPADTRRHIIERQRIITHLYLILLGLPRPTNSFSQIRRLHLRLFRYNHSSQLGGVKHHYNDSHSRVIPPPVFIHHPINRGIKG